MELRSCVAVAVAQIGSCSSDSTASLRTSICHGRSPKKQNKTKEKKKTHKTISLSEKTGRAEQNEKWTYRTDG